MRNILKSSVYVVTVMLFTACGGGTVYSTSSTPPPPLTGTFIDSAVIGLNYTCSSGLSGTTNSLGEFTCRETDTVTFSVGAYEIGNCTAAEVVSPYTLYPSNNTAAINVAQLLQTIDSDNDPLINGITIPEGFNALDTLTTTPADDTFEADVLALLAGTPLVNETTAQIHLHETLGLAHESTGFTADWIENRTLYAVVRDNSDYNNDGNYIDWLIVAEKYENGSRSRDKGADGSLEITSDSFVINNGVLDITTLTDSVTKTMVDSDNLRIVVDVNTSGIETTEYDFFNKEDAEAYILTVSDPCSCGYFTDVFIEGNILYEVVLDTDDKDGDGNTTEYLLIASKYENGKRLLDFNADGTFEVTDDTYEIIGGVLQITEAVGGDVISHELITAFTTGMSISISVNGGASVPGYMFYNKADAEDYRNNL